MTTNLPTLKNYYANGDCEYVFAVKSRPFACLVSPHLPTPTTSLMDYSLVSSLGLKMSDLKCQKFFFGGYKMRILSKVSLTVQTIQDGLPCGTFHIKANVVTDIIKNFDTDWQSVRAEMPCQRQIWTAKLVSELCCFITFTDHCTLTITPFPIFQCW